jgi:hypothetical protein
LTLPNFHRNFPSIQESESVYLRGSPSNHKPPFADATLDFLQLNASGIKKCCKSLCCRQNIAGSSLEESVPMAPEAESIVSDMPSIQASNPMILFVDFIKFNSEEAAPGFQI